MGLYLINSPSKYNGAVRISNQLSYLSHERPANAQTRLHRYPAASDSSAFAHTKYGCIGRPRQDPIGYMYAQVSTEQKACKSTIVS